MFSALWFIVPAVLLMTLLVALMAFATWLAHNLAGYPMLLLQSTNRGPAVASVAVKTSSATDAFPDWAAFADRPEARASSRVAETVIHRTGHF